MRIRHIPVKQMGVLFKVFLGLFLINTAAILGLALSGKRGRPVLWAVQANMLWLWLLVVSLAGLGLQHIV